MAGDSVAIDTREIDTLAGYLEHAGRASDVVLAKVVKRGAVNVKKDARTAAGGHRRAPGLAYSIGFDIEDGGMRAVIGPDKGVGSGALGTFYEYGSATAAPQPFLAPALDAEEPRFVAQIAAAARELLW